MDGVLSGGVAGNSGEGRGYDKRNFAWQVIFLSTIQNREGGGARLRAFLAERIRDLWGSLLSHPVTGITATSRSRERGAALHVGGKEVSPRPGKRTRHSRDVLKNRVRPRGRKVDSLLLLKNRAYHASWHETNLRRSNRGRRRGVVDSASDMFSVYGRINTRPWRRERCGTKRAASDGGGYKYRRGGRAKRSGEHTVKGWLLARQTISLDRISVAQQIVLHTRNSARSTEHMHMCIGRV